MKVLIVSSRLFVPGRIMTPFRLMRERDALLEKQERLKAELARIPARIAEAEQQAAAMLSEFEQMNNVGVIKWHSKI